MQNVHIFRNHIFEIFALDRQTARREYWAHRFKLEFWLVFWQSRRELWLCCCRAELTLCVRMRFFYALFHTEHSSAEMALGGAVLDRDALFQAANKPVHWVATSVNLILTTVWG